jgi:large conductance mechanosensitive channel
MVKEFRDFINRGNLVDIAVGFVMGVAFASVVSVLVNRIVNPLIGLIFNVSSLDTWLMFGKIDKATGLQAGSVGAFFGAVINFVIVAFVMFLVVKAYNRMKAKEEEAAPAAPPEDIQLLREIRDSLSR